MQDLTKKWIGFDVATHLIYSLKDPITRQFANAAFFEIECGMSKQRLHPDGLFDCEFFARTVIRLFSDHGRLFSIKAGAVVHSEDVAWPNDTVCCQVTEAIHFYKSISPATYRSHVILLAVDALTEEARSGIPPCHPFDASLFLKVIDKAISSEVFFFGVLDGVDFDIPAT